MKKLNFIKVIMTGVFAMFCVSAASPQAASDEVAMTQCTRTPDEEESEMQDMGSCSQQSCPSECKPRKKRECKRCKEPDSPCSGNQNRK